LLENGANIDEANRAGHTALIYAAKSGYTEVASLLLDKGANIDKADENGSTAFEIEDELEPRNLLEILIDLPLVDEESANLITVDGLSGGITGEVQLEIEPARASG
ncbi:MAG: hypothetical protein HOB20_13500, partial [Planctomycetaceae bacterium]|nr:hypothetical protein [Planctomycetaceae bacterium]